MKVFVYGSLKKNFGNHVLLQYSEFIGEGITCDPQFTMVNLGSFPGVVQNGNGYIRGEVYQINQPTLTRLDILEGEGNFYSRRKINVNIDNEIHECFIYVLIRNYSFVESIKNEKSYKDGTVFSWKKDYQILVENSI